MPVFSLLADNVHDPLPDESVNAHSCVEDSFTLTVPVGREPEYSGETVTDSFSVCSCP